MADDLNRNEPARYSVRPGVRLSEVVSRVSWSAIWAGVMIALGMEALFISFGLFVGFGIYDSTAANPWAGVSAWTTVWYLVTAGWSMFFGAWCAARLSGNPVREAAILHGITTWGFAAVATLAIAVVGSWAVLREGINLLGTSFVSGAQALPSVSGQVAQATQQAGQALNQVQNSGATAQATANLVSGLALRTCGGVLLGFITAIFGGWLGRPHTVIIEQQQTPAGPTRLAA